MKTYGTKVVVKFFLLLSRRALLIKICAILRAKCYSEQVLTFREH